jgi:hypothetical protein
LSWVFLLPLVADVGQALSGVGKQVFPDTHHQVQMAVPIHPYFVREKPGRIERLCE